MIYLGRVLYLEPSDIVFTSKIGEENESFSLS
jgi:hypothetical protein